MGKKGCAWWVLVSVSPRCAGASTGLGTFWLEKSFFKKVLKPSWALTCCSLPPWEVLWASCMWTGLGWKDHSVSGPPLLVLALAVA